MASSSSHILRVIASSVTAANRAGKIIRDILATGDLRVVDKGQNDLQTEADRAAERCIVASLSRQYPNLSIIGEEAQTSSVEVPSDWVVTDCEQSVLLKECPEIYKNVAEKDIVVWVDPLDGTNEFTQGFLEHVTVLIGVAVNGKAVGGVIHQPYFNYKVNSNNVGRTIWGLVGLGVEGINPESPPVGSFIVTTTRSHSNELVNSTLDALHPDEVIRVGGAGHKVLLVIEGKAHAYVFASRGCKKWDTCAPEAILTALGGKLTDFNGKPYSYHKDVEFPNVGGVLATAKGVNHDEIVAKLPQAAKDALK